MNLLKGKEELGFINMKYSVQNYRGYETGMNFLYLLKAGNWSSGPCTANMFFFFSFMGFFFLQKRGIHIHVLLC